VGSYYNNPKAANHDIKAGEYYDIDLTKPPFSVQPAPVEVPRAPGAGPPVQCLVWGPPAPAGCVGAARARRARPARAREGAAAPRAAESEARGGL
jgi:hypothetical protein